MNAEERRAVTARLISGSTIGEDAEAYIQVKAKGILHREIVQQIEALPELIAALKGLLTLEELEFGDQSLLPSDHPVIMAKAALTKAGVKL